MENFLIYIGKSALAAGAFYLVFLALFQNRKQFLFNRIYLPASLALSFLIPLITFTSVRYIEARPMAFSNSFSYLSETTVSIIAEPEIVWTDVLFLIYISGIVLFLGYLILGHYKAFRIVRASKLREFFGTSVNVTRKDVHPFSFFNKIVVSEKITRNPNLEMIVQHEQIHVRERHTIDLLIGEILFLFQWFNPFAWLIKDAMKNNLEYLTDHQVTQRHNAEAYQLAMVGLADKKGVAPFLTALNGSQLKNRIIMMKQKTENKYSLLKQLVVLPLLAVLIMGLSNKEVKTEFIPKNDKETGVVNGVQNSNVSTEVSYSDTVKAGYNDPNVEFVNVQRLNFDIEKTEDITIENFLVKGKVTDENGTPLGEVTILEKGANVGTTSDVEGNYEISTDKFASLVFVMPGFGKKEVDINNQSTINVKLSASKNEEKDEVVVVGYGQLEKTKLGSKDSTQKSGWKISGAFNGIMSNDAPVTFNSNSKEGLKISLTGKDAPLLIVDGKESKDASLLGAVNIESISVLKDATATELYGDKAHNGVILVTTKGKLKISEPLYIVDGEIFPSSQDLNPDDVESVSVLKEKSAIALYGETGKNGAVIVTTKSSGKKVSPVPSQKNGLDSASKFRVVGNQGNGEETLSVSYKNGNTFNGKTPLLIVDGEKTDKNIDSISPENIKSISVWKDESACQKYGEDAENGVVVVQTKDYALNSLTELRKYIAEEILYPKKAQEASQDGEVKLGVKIAKNGDVSKIFDELPQNAESLDEVVVVGYKSDKTLETEIDADNVLNREVRRVVDKLPILNIPELKGKNIIVSVKFMLQ